MSVSRAVAAELGYRAGEARAKALFRRALNEAFLEVERGLQRFLADLDEWHESDHLWRRYEKER
jgi:hypothetical protein